MNIKESFQRLFTAYSASIKGVGEFNLDEVKNSYEYLHQETTRMVEVHDEDEEEQLNYLLEYYKYLYFVSMDYLDDSFIELEINQNFKFNLFKSLISLVILRKEFFKDNKNKKYKKIFETSMIQNFIGLKSLFEGKTIHHKYTRTDTLFLLGLFRLIVALTLKSLNVKFTELERKVAHYTRIDVANYMINKKSLFRINSTEFMNDPTEGTLIKKYLNLIDNDSYKYHHNFLSCFTFNHNYLNQFRLYGRTNGLDGTGISLVIDNTFFDDLNRFYFDEEEVDLDKKIANKSVLPLFRCCYFDPDSEYISVAKRSKYSFFQEFKGKKKPDEIEVIWNRYIKDIRPIEENVRLNLNFLKVLIDDLKSIYKIGNEKVWGIIGEYIKPINYLFKHSAFKEEEECRIIKITNLNDKAIKNEINENGVTFTYIEYEADIKKSLKNIYIGPASAKYLTFFKVSLIQQKIKDIKICVSENPLRIY